jgi:hypothetical protein
MYPGSQITPERDWILAVFRLPLKTARCAAAKAVPVRIDSALAHGVTRGLDPRVHLLRKMLLRRRWIAPELGPARVPHYCEPQVG